MPSHTHNSCQPHITLHDVDHGDRAAYGCRGIRHIRSDRQASPPHRRQQARTDDLIFDIPHLIAYLSAICTLEPGDLIFTGTPSGVGVMSGTFLKSGDTITTTIEGIGTMVNRCVHPWLG